MRVCTQLRQLRTERNITQQQLADAIGVSRQTVNAIEREKYSPSLEVAFLIAKTLAVSLETVFQFQQD